MLFAAVHERAVMNAAPKPDPSHAEELLQIVTLFDGRPFFLESFYRRTQR